MYDFVIKLFKYIGKKGKKVIGSYKKIMSL